MNILSRAGDKVAPHVDHIREALLNEEVLHCDETGIRAVKKKWLHVVSSRRYTYYQAHEKRGYAAIADMGILPRFSGVMVHDFWKTYFNGNLPGHHAMCNDHLLRELQGIIDTRPDQTWAHRMQTYLRESWKEVKIARQSATGQLPDARSRELTITYGHILKEAEEELKALTPRRVKRRKNAALSDAESLWRRFVEYGEAILRFIHDPRVPFGNSQAERDIRMMKVKLKVSGTFRTDRGADLFADLRSFVSSARKQGWDAFSALRLMLADSFSFSGLAT
jgi:transposase